jgi:hypothetical protein
MMNAIDYLREQLEGDKGIPITLNEYIEAYYNSKILPYDSKYDSMVSAIANNVVVINPSMPYEGRINEYGNHLENILCASVEELYGVKAENLGTGYPDIRFNIDGVWFYGEVKIGPDLWKKPDTFRMFYTSTPKPKTIQRKNIQDGYHLLFHFEHAGPGALTGRWRVTDLDGFSYLAYGQIQQGSTKDLYDVHNKVVMENK